jgi:transmembrane sensor
LKEKKSLSQLFQRYLNNQCTKEEIKELLNYFDVGKNEVELRRLIHQQMEKDGDGETAPSRKVLLDASFANIKQAIANSTKQATIVPIIKRTWFRVSAAAALLILFSVTVFLLSDKNQEVSIAKKKTQIQNDVAPGHDNAVLTLADGATIVLDSAANGTLAQQGDSKILKLNGQIAYNSTGTTSGKPVFNTISTAKGNQYQLILSDGSKVWLNAASSIHFPASFTGNERKVEVTGEAYFEVARNTSKPFKVAIHSSTGDGEVEVLGTHFNINAYNDEPEVKTTLLEGAVKIKKANAVQVLSPGQQAKLTPNEIVVDRNVDLSQVVAWKDGFFQFNNTDIKTLMRQVSRWYDVEVNFDGKITEEGFTGKIPRNVTLSKLLKVLELNDVHFKTEDRMITVMP